MPVYLKISPIKKSKKSKTKKIMQNNIDITIKNIKEIFSNNKKISKDIVFLKKISFDIFYSYKYKYPLLIREELNKFTGKGNAKIIRDNITDMFDSDPNIPIKYSYINNDYLIYTTYYKGSYGHMAPAFWHKLNIEDYYETFLFSNIIPQNYIMNTGIWNFLEKWCFNLQYLKNIVNINIFTGCIPRTTNSIIYNANLDKIELNIPTDMFKIIVFNHINFPNITFIDIIIIKNKEINITKNNKIININLNKYILKQNLYKSFESTTGLNIIKLLQFYNINTTNLESFKKNINLICIPNKLRNAAINISFVYWYNFLSSPTLDKLYEITKIDIDKLMTFENFDLYLVLYFYGKRNLLIREKILFTVYKSLEEFDLFFNKFKDELYNKYIINQDIEKKLFKISQDEYLIKYYDTVKTKLAKLTS